MLPSLDDKASHFSCQAILPFRFGEKHIIISSSIVETEGKGGQSYLS